MDNPVRIFVASTPTELLSVQVLNFSILETTQNTVEVTPIYTAQRPFSMPQSRENRPRTPFSFQRFLIPELCNFSGCAIYLDADMQVFSDIAELWNQDFCSCDIQTVQAEDSGRRGQFSVLLMDCDRLDWNIDHIVADLDSGKLNYDALMYEMRVAKKIGRDIDPAWNSLEHFQPGVTKLLHYTDMNTQPWISTANPLAHLWMSCLRRAVAANFITREHLLSETEKGHIRPSLLPQLDSGIDDTIALPKEIRRLDQEYIPPYRRLRSSSSRPWTTLSAGAFAFLRRKYYQSPIARLFR